MKPDFEEIIREHNVHQVFLNDKGMIKALEKTYDLGVFSKEEQYESLKNAYLDLLECWCTIRKPENLEQEKKYWKYLAKID